MIWPLYEIVMVMDGYDEMVVWLFYKRNERGSTEKK